MARNIASYLHRALSDLATDRITSDFKICQIKNEDLFNNMCSSQHCLHHLLHPVQSVDNLRKRDHFSLPDYNTKSYNKSFVLRSLYNFIERLIHQIWFLAHAVGLVSAVITYNTRSTSTPAYLSDLLQDYRPARTLDHRTNGLPLMALAFSAKAFSVSAPSVWNSLSYQCRSAELFSSFRRILINKKPSQCWDSQPSVGIRNQNNTQRP